MSVGGVVWPEVWSGGQHSRSLWVPGRFALAQPGLDPHRQRREGPPSPWSGCQGCLLVPRRRPNPMAHHFPGAGTMAALRQAWQIQRPR